MFLFKRVQYFFCHCELLKTAWQSKEVVKKIKTKSKILILQTPKNYKANLLCHCRVSLAMTKDNAFTVKLKEWILAFIANIAFDKLFARCENDRRKRYI
jgi:hypothetical protein